MGHAYIERLSFAPDEPHQAIEAAIHLCRYQLARPLCSGKRVLDVACGEGYGARLMLDWGAASVDGVDVSEEAIARANDLFRGERVRFHQLAAERLEETFAPGSFDLAITLETMEHVPDPASFLRSLRRLVAPGGAIVVSCPNDHWYYPREEDRNPFHLRKFTFDEFRILAEDALGTAAMWLLGTPAEGFMNVVASSDLIGRTEPRRTVMFEARDEQTIVVPTEEHVDGANCAYFVGVWATAVDAGRAGGAVIHPASMDSGSRGAARRSLPLASDVDRLRHDLAQARADVEESRRLVARHKNAASTAIAENALLRDSVARMKTELAEAREKLAASEAGRVEALARVATLEAEWSGHSCYATLERKVTAALPGPAGKFVGWAGSRARSTARRILPR
jgi:SAM-dependent methyltransferase